LRDNSDKSLVILSARNTLFFSFFLFFLSSLRAMGVLSGSSFRAHDSRLRLFLEIITNRDGERPADRTNEYSGTLGAALRIRRCVNGPEK